MRLDLTPQSLVLKPDHISASPPSTPRHARTMSSSASSSVSSSPITNGQPKPTLPSTLVPTEILPSGSKSLSGIALRAFCLGGALFLSASTALLLATAPYTLPASPLARAAAPLWRPALFLASLALFHFLEFYTTALANTRYATVSAFLLSTNGRAYDAAHAFALAECVVAGVLVPRWQARVSHPAIIGVGLVLIVVGQAVRSTAMLQAGANFNHTVQTRKASEHVLVQHGVYRVLRHPSYFGFFWWALGTQIAIGNVLGTAAFFVVLCGFFGRRIAKEEEYLTRFFGSEYSEYRRRTWVGIPLVGFFG